MSKRPPLPPPHILENLVPDSPAFSELLRIEHKLDWTLLRKKAEINDALGRPARVKRTLRVFISNTFDQETLGWVLRIEGRLLDSGNVRLDKTRRKFSTFLRCAVVEMDGREVPTYPEGNIVEWHPSPASPLDGFEVSRKGDINVNCRIVLHIDHFPAKYRVLPPLADLVNIKEGTRHDVMMALWKQVKVSGAQDKDDPTLIRRVGGFEKILPEDTHFHSLPELVSRHLTHPDPIVLPYTIRVDQEVGVSQCFDIPIEIDDPIKTKMASILQGEENAEIVQLEDKVAELAYIARDTKQKRDFLEGFAASPQAFIQNWLGAQARDLDQMLGYQIAVGNGSVREEDLRRSDLFSLPWVDQAI